MKFKGDFHVHTCLSPCADVTMVPNEMARRFSECGVDWVGITDHNSCGNVRVFENVFSRYGIKVLPGIEIQSVEEVHVLAYFPSVAIAEEFSKIIKSHLPNVKNDPEVLGYQLLVDETDHFIGMEEKILSVSVNLNLNEIFELVRKFHGLFIYAHVDRAFGVLKQLGFIPKEPAFDAIECIGKTENFECTIFKSSDAHHLDQINSPKVEIDAQKRDFDGFKIAVEKGQVFPIENDRRSSY